MREPNTESAISQLLGEMEASAAQLRALIVAMPPEELLGYTYWQRLMSGPGEVDSQPDGRVDGSHGSLDDYQFLLEYVHAVLAADPAPPEVAFDEGQWGNLFELSRKLRTQAISFAQLTCGQTKSVCFGAHTAQIQYQTMFNWITVRGNRFQVLESEFYRYVLAPHDDVLREAYGIGALEIGAEFQAMADAARTGHQRALTHIEKEFDRATRVAAAEGKQIEEVADEWIAMHPEQLQLAGRAFFDLFRGGVTNVSRHTKLPLALLADLAYQRGEECEFFSPGVYAGTPFRTLPARKKPLIQIGADYHAVDPCFARDAGYRALLYNLLQRRPDYRSTFEARQKQMSEGALADILAEQLPGALVFRDIYYKNPLTKEWCESDVLVLIDDVLFLIEAKSGAGATIASPALDFERHARSVEELVLKAYAQCKRFFNYLNSSDEVALYRLENGTYNECGRVRRDNYRVKVPIGLTVESFAPFSASCKELEQVKPLLGSHAFVSLAIDDLFVLKPFLPTTGEFAHYMEVRQALASMPEVYLFDELDHLGAYLSENRFDLRIGKELKRRKAAKLICTGMSDILNECFEGDDWETRTFPRQSFPYEVQELLEALDASRAPGWLRAESNIRNLGESGRKNLNEKLADVRGTLHLHPARYFLLAGGSEALFVWLQRNALRAAWAKIHAKASAAALASKASSAIGIFVEVGDDGAYLGARPFPVDIPAQRTAENSHIYEDARKMAVPERMQDYRPVTSEPSAIKGRKLGRNDLCPCGSGRKYKKCHGR